MASGHPNLAGRHVLVVEDEFLLAYEMAETLAAWGAEVIGPAANLSDALLLVERSRRLDAAVLDMNLKGEWSVAVADALAQRGVNFVLTTGYDARTIPSPYDKAPVCEKPVDAAQLARAIAGATRRA